MVRDVGAREGRDDPAGVVAATAPEERGDLPLPGALRDGERLDERVERPVAEERLEHFPCGLPGAAHVERLEQSVERRRADLGEGALRLPQAFGRSGRGLPESPEVPAGLEAIEDAHRPGSAPREEEDCHGSDEKPE